MPGTVGKDLRHDVRDLVVLRHRTMATRSHSPDTEYTSVTPFHAGEHVGRGRNLRRVDANQHDGGDHDGWDSEER